MTTKHLDQSEQPCIALFRLLQLVNHYTQKNGAFDLNEAQLAEAIIYQANQAHEIIIAGMAALQPLLPPALETFLPQHSSISFLLDHLHHEADATKKLAERYQRVMHAFYVNNPYASPIFVNSTYHQAVEQTRALVAKYDKHYYFPLGRMMQLLPGDITNQPALTNEQAEMCAVVSKLAGKAAFVIGEGLTVFKRLQFLAKESTVNEKLPDCTEFVAYLEAEIEFMRENMNDYGDGAQWIKRAP